MFGAVLLADVRELRDLRIQAVQRGSNAFGVALEDWRSVFCLREREREDSEYYAEVWPI